MSVFDFILAPPAMMRLGLFLFLGNTEGFLVKGNGFLDVLIPIIPRVGSGKFFVFVWDFEGL